MQHLFPFRALGAVAAAVAVVASALVAPAAQAAPATSGLARPAVTSPAAVSAPAGLASVQRLGALSSLKAPNTFVYGAKVFVPVKVRSQGVRTVRLQERRGSSWVTVASAKTARNGAATLSTWTRNVSASTFRVDVPSARSAVRATGAWTAKRQAVGATVASSSAAVQGTRLSVTVKTSGAPVKSSVILQRKKGNSWVTVASGKLPRTNATLTLRPVLTAGLNQLRAKLTTPARVTKYSSTRSVYGVYKCVSAGAAPTRVSYTYNRPDGGKWGYETVKGKRVKTWIPAATNGKGIVDPLIRAVCAAKRGSTVTMATYIVSDADKSTVGLFRALEYKARVDGVKVRFVLEQRNSGLKSSTVSALRKWSTVTVCQGGCFNFESARAAKDRLIGVNHSKFLAISDTNWDTKKVDPYVWYSSSNFNDRQVLKYWHNAVGVRDAGALYADTVSEYNKMRACSAGEAACKKVAGLKKHQQLRVYGHQALVLPSAAAQNRSGDAGVTMKADFFPKTSGVEDPARTLLKSMKCTAGSTLRVSNYLWSESRLNRIEADLIRLAREGCRIQFVVSYGGAFVSQDSTTARLTAIARKAQASGAAGGKGGKMEIRYRTLMHLKTVEANKVTFNGAPNRFVWYGGAQNFTKAGLFANNENMLLLTDSAARTSGGLTSLRQQSGQQFNLLWNANLNRNT